MFVITLLFSADFKPKDDAAVELDTVDVPDLLSNADPVEITDDDDDTVDTPFLFGMQTHCVSDDSADVADDCLLGRPVVATFEVEDVAAIFCEFFIPDDDVEDVDETDKVSLLFFWPIAESFNVDDTDDTFDRLVVCVDDSDVADNIDATSNLATAPTLEDVLDNDVVALFSANLFPTEAVEDDAVTDAIPFMFGADIV